jgi:hypothetical protein
MRSSRGFLEPLVSYVELARDMSPDCRMATMSYVVQTSSPTMQEYGTYTSPEWRPESEPC